MIRNLLIERYNNSIYPTMVIIENGKRRTSRFMPGFDNEFRNMCKLYGERILDIMKNNPHKIESITMDGVKHFFVTERRRIGDDTVYVAQFVYAIIEDNERLFYKLNFIRIIYDSCNLPQEQKMSDASVALVEYIKHRTKISKFISDFLCFRLKGFFENEKSSYFYKINDVIKYAVENYFQDGTCPCRFKVNYLESNMYTQMNLNLFMFFMVNLLLTLSKYTVRTSEIEFENNLTTLETKIKCHFHRDFLIDNDDIDLENACKLKSTHPAFMDFEFVKHLADSVGAALSLEYEKLDCINVRVTVSKTDIVFKNLLRTGKFSGENSDIPIYTVDVSELI